MSTQAPFALRGRNPDVLTSIANLSNDEVFTPPEFANRMLDTLAEAWAESNDGANIWADSSVTFLDPFTKSGVFLREITKRLVDGLVGEIPNLQDRVNHVLTKQVFGIGITELTSLLARRSVYCSKWANGDHSICTAFDNEQGNIWFERTEHTWVGGTEKVITMDENGEAVLKPTNGKCKFCGARQTQLDRSPELETHAYAFIHSHDIKARLSELFGVEMKFDVIIGNPPYQMSGGAGGSSDSSIYQLFVEQAQSLEPRFLSMVIPSRWLAGGRGLGAFRENMLRGRKIRSLIDYPASKEVFPGVDVMGGIGYFLWSPDFDGDAHYSVVRGAEVFGPTVRDLGEFDIFVRDERAVGILRKVLAQSEDSVTQILSSDTPFGIPTNVVGYREVAQSGDVPLYLVKAGKRTVGYIARASVRKNAHLVDRYKVLAPEAYGGTGIPDSVLGKPIVAPANSVCSQTFLVFDFGTLNEAENFESYYCTKFFRFLVSLRKITQHALNSTYAWVPMQNWSKRWTDHELYEKYKLSPAEIEFIESVIKPMETAND